MNIKHINGLIKKYGLQPATERGWPLLNLSCVGLTYARLLKALSGYSYRAIGGLGDERHWHSMFNEEYVAKKTGEMILKKPEDTQKFFGVAQKIYKQVQRKFPAVGRLAKRDPLRAVEVLLQLQSDNMLATSVYNCFWRYFGNSLVKQRHHRKLFEKVSLERNVITGFYPEIEKRMLQTLALVERLLDVPSGCLKMASRVELAQIIRDKSVSSHLVVALRRRKAGYFYLYDGVHDKEYIVDDQRQVNRLRRQYFSCGRKARFTGVCSFCGWARGRVACLAGLRKKPTQGSGYVLVASSTHPKDLSFIRKAAAIVADEGGLLSHAAIISRELRIPCVIGTKIATQVLKDGDMVVVDANLGIVRKLST